jgi:hypothetical protein
MNQTNNKENYSMNRLEQLIAEYQPCTCQSAAHGRLAQTYSLCRAGNVPLRNERIQDEEKVEIKRFQSHLE